jgi:hypothetical protein
MVSVLPSTYNTHDEAYSVGTAENVTTSSAQRVSAKTTAVPIFMNGSLKLNKSLYGLKQVPPSVAHNYQ